MYGYTDFLRFTEVHQGLSVRRATAVQAELVKNGVPQNAITIQRLGDARAACSGGDRAGRARAAESPCGDHHPLTSDMRSE